MLKSALIHCDFNASQAEFRTQWAQFLGHLHPLCMPVGNQPLILWALEALAKAGYREIALIDPFLTRRPDLHEQLKRIAHSIYGFELRFTAQLEHIPPDVRRRSLYLEGTHLHFFDEDNGQIQTQTLQHLGDYYHENMRSATYWQARVTLPFFDRQGQVSFGERCKLHARSICRQSLLGKHVVVKRDCHIIGSIVGEYSHLGPQTQVFGSLILPHTRLGRDLHILGKIVVGNHLIDPLSGAWTTTDPIWCRGQKYYTL